MPDPLQTTTTNGMTTPPPNSSNDCLKVAVKMGCDFYRQYFAMTANENAQTLSNTKTNKSKCQQYRQTAVFSHDLPRCNSINASREWMGHNVVTTVSLTRPSYFARSFRLVRSKELGWALARLSSRKIDSFARYLRVPHHHLGRSHYLVNLYVTSEYYPTILYNLHKQWFRKSGTDLERIFILSKIVQIK